MEDNKSEEKKKELTINDIANKLGVSKSTVSRAISGKGRLSAETRERILEYIQEHNYRPNLIARSLAKSKTFNIGVVLPADTNLTQIPFFQACLMGICDVAAGFDYDVVVTTATETDISLIQKLIQNNKVDGIVLTRPVFNDKAIEYLKETQKPFVVVGSGEDHEVIHVDNNHMVGCAELTSILVKSGYRKIALLLGNKKHIVNKNRYKGFVNGFKESGLKVDESLIYRDMDSKVVIERAIDAIVSRQVDCIVCSDDIICSTALTRLNEVGCSVPKDIKVASFYDSTYLQNYNPPITALSIDIKTLGIEAGKCLLNYIEGNKIPDKVLLDYEIILRKSSM